MEIPRWLQHLRCDRRGIPVPWINRWVAPGTGGELAPDRVRIRRDRWVGGPGLFEVERPGDVPDFTRQDMGRQRESTIAGLCQVCGRPVPWARRLLVVADIATQVVDIDGVGEALVLTEPWLDRICARFALEHCPALIRRTRDEHLTLAVRHEPGPGGPHRVPGLGRGPSGGGVEAGPAGDVGEGHRWPRRPAGREPVRPPAPYYGSKQTIARKLVELMPPHQHYVEPFCGSLAVLLEKPPVAHETVNDLDGALVTFWRVLRDRPDDLCRVAALTPHSRAEHLAAYDLAGCDELEVARRVWVQLTQGRGGSRRRTGWRFYRDPANSSTSMPGYLRGYVDRMPPAADRLARVSLECRPALDVIRDYGTERDVLLYVDPPYLGSTRSSRQYEVEMSTAAEHRDLAEALHGCTSAVVLSGYASPLYDDLYAGWDRLEIAAFTGQAGDAQQRTEVVWSNRPLAAEHDLLAELAAEVG